MQKKKSLSVSLSVFLSVMLTATFFVGTPSTILATSPDDTAESTDTVDSQDASDATALVDMAGVPDVEEIWATIHAKVDAAASAVEKATDLAPLSVAATSSIDITGYPDVATIQTDIQAEIDAVTGVGGGEVTVTGTFIGASTNLQLAIPEDVKVIWQANYEGNAEYLIHLGLSDGTFEVGAGSNIVNNRYQGVALFSEHADIFVYGGTVTIAGDEGYAIRCNGGVVFVEDGGNVTTNGISGSAIYCSSGTVYIGTDGAVSANGMWGSAIYTDADGDVVLDGGAIMANANGTIGIFSNSAGIVDIASGSITTMYGNSYGIISYYDSTIYIEDVLIQVKGDHSVGIATSSYNSYIAMLGGSITVTGDACYGIQGESEVVYLVDSTITCSGGNNVGISINDNGLMTYGTTTITVSGGTSTAIRLTGSGYAVLQGNPGSISATGALSCALCIEGNGSGVIVYLAGIVNGTAAVAGFGSRVNYGVIIEVDSLGIPFERHGSRAGLTVIDIGASTAAMTGFDYYWNTLDYYNANGTYAVIMVKNVWKDNYYIYSYPIPWVYAVVPANTLSLTYQTHVQNVGWQAPVGLGQMSGTSGRSLRLEGLKIDMLNTTGYEGGISYSTHIQNIGWQQAVSISNNGIAPALVKGGLSGTEGRSLRLEAMRISLTGELANHYDIYYRVHAQDVGWMGWATNGGDAGTAGHSLRLEGLQIVIVAKGAAAPANTYNGITAPAGTPAMIDPSIVSSGSGYTATVHIQDIGDRSYTSATGATILGTTGSSRRLEAMTLSLRNAPAQGSIKYEVHVQNIGWQGMKTSGQMAGTSGQSLRLEALRIELTGEMANRYDVYYRTHVQNIGWTGWAKNGQSCGSAGYSYRMEAMQIVIVPKGTAPGFNSGYFYQR